MSNCSAKDRKLYFYGDVEGLLPALRDLQEDGYFRMCKSPEEGFPVEVTAGGENQVSCDGKRASIRFTSKTLFFRQLGRLFARMPAAFSEDTKSYFEEVGVMFDCSRNGVLTVDAFRRFARRLALMGYTYVLLYMEETYEVEELAYFGYMRGRYSQEELSVMDSYAADFGLELIPCIQALAHLEKYLRWEEAAQIRDTSNVVLAGAPETREFVKKILKGASAPFGTRKIHLGMDEAWGLGSGRYLARYGYRPSIEILRDHLSMVMELCREMELEPMIWSDMFFRPLNESGDYYDEAPIPEDTLAQIRKAIPEGLSLVYWDYYHFEKEAYSKLLAKHQQMTDQVIFAGGIWTWNGLTPNQGKAFDVTSAALAACRERNIRNVFTTMWGDNGAETSPLGALLTLQMYGEYAYTEKEPARETIYEAFAACCNEDPAAFYDLRLLDEVPSIPAGNPRSADPSKYLLYQNPLYGLYDRHVEAYLKNVLAERRDRDGAQYTLEEILFDHEIGLESLHNYYQELSRKLRLYGKKSAGCALLFAHYANLADLLSEKAELGCAIRLAYESGEPACVEECIFRINSLLDMLPEFTAAWSRLWNTTCKAVGFEAIRIRLGALEGQLKYALQCLNDFLACGARIEELELPLLPFNPLEKDADGKEVPPLNVHGGLWERIVSSNPVAGV